jgi:hypothetical protein
MCTTLCTEQQQQHCNIAVQNKKKWVRYWQPLNATTILAQHSAAAALVAGAAAAAMQGTLTAAGHEYLCINTPQNSLHTETAAHLQLFRCRAIAVSH